MDELALIRDLMIAWLSALAAGALAARLKLPLLSGYVLAGVVLGPHGSKLISQASHVHALSELGVALLLFALGVEISLRRVFQSSTPTIVASAAQIILTTVVAACIALVAGVCGNHVSALIFGFICTLSSTAVVTKLLVDRGEADSVAGRLLISVLLVQDLTLVPVVALLPGLADPGGDAVWVIAMAAAKALLLVGFVIVGSTKLVPRLLDYVVRANSRELFGLTVISLCLGVAFVGKELGVSMALGAFLSGIMVSERPYGNQVLAEVMPLRDLFATIFFVSVGMNLDPWFIGNHWPEVVSFVVLLVAGKTAVGAAAGYLSTRSIWSATLVGVGLAQIGEFSFVLATMSNSLGLLPDNAYNLFFAGAVVTLAISPAIIGAAPRALGRLVLFRRSRKLDSGDDAPVGGHFNMSGHLVLCGYGRTGRNLGLALESYGIPFVVVELNSEIIRELDVRGVPHIYGDAFSTVVLEKANLRQASCLVVTVPDPVVATQIIAFARRQRQTESKTLTVIARGHNADEIELFRAAGADAVVQPEFEASIEITRLALKGLHRSGPEILRAAREIESRRYMVFRPERFADFVSEEFVGTWYCFAGQDEPTLQSLDVRRRTGATIMAIKLEGELVVNPDSSLGLLPQSHLYVSGNEHQLDKFEQTYPVSRFCPVTQHSSTAVQDS